MSGQKCNVKCSNQHHECCTQISKPSVEAAEIRRQGMEEAAVICDSYKNENYAIDVCDTAKEIAKEIRGAAPSKPGR